MTNDETTPTNNKRCHVGVVFALGAEAAGLVNRLSDVVTTRGPAISENMGHLSGRCVSVIESGAGREKAALGTKNLIHLRSPIWIISAGFAGALCDEVRRDDLLMANAVVHTDGSTLAIDLQIDPTASPSVHVGRWLWRSRHLAK